MIADLVRGRGYDYAFKIVQVNALPRGANGKVNRKQLKAAVSNQSGS
jgi:acyl-coenzyme A synthetase/AMP-(fatty) acid ligase